MFYKVQITECNFNHNHDLSGTFYRRGLQSSRGKNKINMITINNAVSMLKVNPRLNSTDLRALLYESIPMGIEINAQYLANLRRKVTLYHAKYPDDDIISNESARELVDNKRVTDIDYEILEDPDIMLNYSKMFRNIMHNDPDSWTAVSFLEKMKVEQHNFDFKIHYGVDGRPDAILYMTAQMKLNLIRYGYVLYLDAQKRPFNKVG